MGRTAGAFEVRLQQEVARYLARIGEPSIQTANYYGEDLSEADIATVWSSVLPVVDRIFFFNYFWTNRFGIRMFQIAESVSPATYYFTIQDLFTSLASGTRHEQEVQTFLAALPPALSYLAQNVPHPRQMEA